MILCLFVFLWSLFCLWFYILLGVEKYECTATNYLTTHHFSFRLWVLTTYMYLERNSYHMFKVDQRYENSIFKHFNSMRVQFKYFRGYISEKAVILPMRM